MKPITSQIESLYRNKELKLIIDGEKVLVSDVSIQDLEKYVVKVESSEDIKILLVAPVLRKVVEIVKREIEGRAKK